MEQLVEQHLPEIKKLMLQYEVERAYLFGSAARGTMTDSSDVDFIIRFPDNMHFTTYADNYFALAEKLEQLLKRNVDLVTEKNLKNPYLLQIINQSKLQLI
jgi:predicted nucleotidyltransferase